MPSLSIFFALLLHARSRLTNHSDYSLHTRLNFSSSYARSYAKLNASAAGNAFGRVCLSVCPVRALTFDSLDLSTSFWQASTSSEYLG